MSRHWKISTGCHFQNGHHNTAQIQHKLSDFSDISYMGRLWCPELIPDIEKFFTGHHFQNHHNATKKSTLFDFNDISYVGRLWCPKLIPDIEKCLPVSIFKMASGAKIQAQNLSQCEVFI
jgi:hypothetical protein